MAITYSPADLQRHARCETSIVRLGKCTRCVNSSSGSAETHAYYTEEWIFAVKGGPHDSLLKLFRRLTNQGSLNDHGSLDSYRSLDSHTSLNRNGISRSV